MLLGHLHFLYRKLLERCGQIHVHTSTHEALFILHLNIYSSLQIYSFVSGFPVVEWLVCIALALSTAPFSKCIQCYYSDLYKNMIHMCWSGGGSAWAEFSRWILVPLSCFEIRVEASLINMHDVEQTRRSRDNEAVQLKAQQHFN